MTSRNFVELHEQAVREGNTLYTQAHFAFGKTLDKEVLAAASQLVQTGSVGVIGDSLVVKTVSVWEGVPNSTLEASIRNFSRVEEELARAPANTPLLSNMQTSIAAGKAQLERMLLIVAGGEILPDAPPPEVPAQLQVPDDEEDLPDADDLETQPPNLPAIIAGLALLLTAAIFSM